MSEHELVERAKKNDNSAFKEIMKLYKAPLHRMIYEMVNDSTLAEDLTMESFEKSFRKIEMYVPTFRLSTWIFTIAKHHTIDYIKSNINRPKFTELDSAMHDHGYNPEQAMIMMEDKLRLEAAVKGLKKKYKDVFNLRDKGASYEQISKKLNIPIGTVKARLNRVRKQLEEKSL